MVGIRGHHTQLGARLRARRLGRAVQWPVFGLADVLTDRSVSRPEVVAESGTAQDVREAGHGDVLGIAAPR